MLYESLGDLRKPRERVRLPGACWRRLLPPSPGDQSEVPFGRYILTAFPLQRIFPDPWRAPAAPLTPNLGSKCAQERLAGDVALRLQTAVAHHR